MESEKIRAIIFTFFLTPLLLTETATGFDHVISSQREIPIIASVDILVIGGSSAGVAAAEAASRDGAKVFLVAPRPYLGEDLCSTLRLELKDAQHPSTPLATSLFGNKRVATPGHIKATLADALVSAGVEFRFSSAVTDILRDQNNELCGVVIANRGGRQAIVSKVIIDSTDYAWVCRMAGCKSIPWTGGKIRFERTILQEGERKGKQSSHTRRICLFDIEMRDFSFESLAEAEQEARDKTPKERLLSAAETLFCVPPTPILCRQSADISLARFRPAGEERLYVLSGCADVSREEAAKLLQPTGLMEIATRIGMAAVKQSRVLTQSSSIHIPEHRGTVAARGDVREILSGGRPVARKLPSLLSGYSAIPVLSTVDVVVVGGGTAGAPAAIAAARNGARTLVIEYQNGLGGMGTLGLIGKPYHGNRRGFAMEVPFPGSVEAKMEWYRGEIRKNGGIIWFGALGCGVCVDGNAVKGAVVCTPEGRGVVLAKVVIDATGSADIAISAGARYMYGSIEEGDIAIQGTGLSSYSLGAYFANSDYLLVDEADMTDVWRALTSVQIAKRADYDVVSLIQTRERRRIVGDFTMRYVDQIAARTYPDSIVFSGSDYDSHGYPSSHFFGLLPHNEISRKANHPAPGGTCYTPYRCFLPRGLDNILVIGLGISMDRDAAAMVRMQYDIANQGYAAGIAACMAVENKTTPRGINVRSLQQHLVEIGSLPASVLSDIDSFPLPDEEIRTAVISFGKSNTPNTAGKPLAVIMTHKEKAIPMLKEAHEKSKGQCRLQYAEVLAALGDKTGMPTLLAALNNAQWDDKINQGTMAEYAHLPTPVDAIILALGAAGDRSATPAILRMLEKLDAKAPLSHHRSVALALENLADPTTAKPLADLLNKPDMRGHVMRSLPKAGKLEYRTESLREIMLARALYRCGDHKELGKDILEQYKNDLRGLFIRHAHAVLKDK